MYVDPGQTPMTRSPNSIVGLRVVVIPISRRPPINKATPATRVRQESSLGVTLLMTVVEKLPPHRYRLDTTSKSRHCSPPPTCRVILKDPAEGRSSPKRANPPLVVDRSKLFIARRYTRTRPHTYAYVYVVYYKKNYNCV